MSISWKCWFRGLIYKFEDNNWSLFPPLKFLSLAYPFNLLVLKYLSTPICTILSVQEVMTAYFYYSHQGWMNIYLETYAVLNGLICECCELSVVFYHFKLFSLLFLISDNMGWYYCSKYLPLVGKHSFWC